MSTDYEAALKTLQANLTPRYRELDRFEAYVSGRQYEGLPHWLTEDEVPLLERAPHIVEPIAESAIESFQELLLGDGRYPTLTSGTEEDDSVFDERFGLSEEQSEQLDKIIEAISEQVGLPQKARLGLGKAMGERSTLGIVCVRDGKLQIDIEPAKSAAVTLHHERRREVLKVEIRYPYLDRYWHDVEKRWAYRCLLYRRVIDAVSDTTYKPALASPEGQEPDSWVADRSVEHNFGFCPCLWYPFMRDESTRTDPDGIALHERVLDEIDALNRTLSQRNRAALYCGDPQPIETGVEFDHNPCPAPPGSEGMRPFVDHAGKATEPPDIRAQNAKWRSGSAATRKGRRKGPGVAWRYPNPESKVAYLLLPPEGLDVLDREASSLRATLDQAMSWVRSDVTGVLGPKGGAGAMAAMSGRTLAWLYKRQTTRCDAIRPDFADGWLLPAVNLLLRVALSYARDQGRGALYLPGLKKLPGLLSRFEQQVTTGQTNPDGAETTEMRWFNPAIRVQWPTAYFQPTEEDQERVANTARADYDGGLITKRTAVERIAPFYPSIGDVDEYVEALEKEAEEREAKAMERTVEETAAIHEVTKNDAAGGTASGRKPPASARGGNGSAGASASAKA